MYSRGLTLLLVGVALVLTCVVHAAPVGRPNILLILTDDLGFSDLGCYGSEIATPNLDRLAQDGLRFSQFYNTAKCHSSRVSLLSGRWCRQAGDVGLSRATTIAEVLREGGYFTAMTGKWHLKKEPTDFGFQRYFGHLSGACNYYRGDKTFRLNGKPWTVPKDGFYTTVANVDFALQFLGEARTAAQPWFLYVAFNAPHAPLQPLEEDYRRYRTSYEKGWDAVRTARAEKQRLSGLFGQAVTPSPRPPHVPAWDALSPEMRDWESRRMAAYAGMIDRIDQEIGRLLADLRRNGELDNTIIVFLSDNGACPYDRRSTGMDRQPYEPDVSWSDSTGWAWARNCPFRYYKQNQFEGGIATPAIVHWPAGMSVKPGALTHTPAHLVDVLPTLAEAAGVSVPNEWPERELTALAGVSLTPLLAGRELPERPPIHLLFSRDRGLRDGDWKLVSFRRQPWELYNIAEDRAEIHNLAAQHSDVVKRMSAQWHEMATNVLMAPARETGAVGTEAGVHIHPEWTDFSSPEASSKRRKPRKKKRIRARIGTKLKTEGRHLVLRCTGADPGLAFDVLPPMSDAGPYRLTFRLKSEAAGDGEIYWTTDEKTKLPRGGHLTFPVTHDGQWQTVTLAIEQSKRLHALRLDVCAGPGKARIEGLQLRDAAGKVIKRWP
ncbi:MAG: arylsulfatase [Lentisphaerae bacterium]|jgi:arylsulfatase A-like enzyme|nr:arylsulfatase [Lentisphaerota bacterium]MBT4823345.1 arylsulfatase [Lentisphaerota bacterium]MBT5611955.1 arylsulfatase [Lentisphaerota bacterium]MBT7062186.1 arylsulfatase [Lentisphaerota bacterium]MBT7843722.1 arylsulfatase [Lentisphaerota bacterium]